ncbi:hypothetical protein [Agrobacterium tumefaciens]|uniref:hypothetical protein n=1 Tax=Agrobacterium tumefaciens TaxID=358 RepID=UPI0015869D30|nr:hypothetical protein [Agrobacterium tumefaciens]
MKDEVSYPGPPWRFERLQTTVTNNGERSIAQTVDQIISRLEKLAVKARDFLEKDLAKHPEEGQKRSGHH